MNVCNQQNVCHSFIRRISTKPQNEKILYIFRTRIEIKETKRDETDKEPLLKIANAELDKNEAMLANYKKVPVRNSIIQHYRKKDGVDDEFIFEISLYFLFK